MRFNQLFGGLHPTIGTIPLRPLPGAAAYAGDLPATRRDAVATARQLVEDGCDGVLVVNQGDGPFERDTAKPETIAAMTLLVEALVDAVPVPVGLTLLRNDSRAAVAVAAVTEARFVRVPVHVGRQLTADGWVEGHPTETLRARTALGSDIVLLADVRAKFDGNADDLRASAHDTYYRGLADALVLDLQQAGGVAGFRQFQAAFPDAPILAAGRLSDDERAELLDLTCGWLPAAEVVVKP